MHGKRRVSARLGWAGEKGDFFSILLILHLHYANEPGIEERLTTALCGLVVEIHTGEQHR